MVVEDAVSVSSHLRRILSKFPILDIVIMAAPMPDKYRDRTGPKPRGVANRNMGMQWVINKADQGVIYFADDDNTYDIRIFQEV